MSSLFETFVEHASRHPGKPAIISDDDRCLTYAELARLSTTLAEALEKQLPDAHGPIALIARDSPITVVLALAASRLGLCLAPLNPTLGQVQLCTAVRSISASLVLHDAAATHALEAVSELCSTRHLETLVNLDDRSAPGSEGGTRLTSDSPATCQGSFEPIGCATSPGTETPYLLTLSSGSTGDPKPVVYTGDGKRLRAIRTAAEFNVTGNDVILCASPFFHSLGQRLTFMPLMLGATLVQLPSFSKEAWLKATNRYSVTFTICVSSHLVALLPALNSGDPRIKSIRALVSSSANIDRATKHALFEQSGFDFFEMYGASEVATATVLSASDLPAKAESVGKPCNGVQLNILDGEGRPCITGEPGQIAVNSPLASPGYFARPDLDACAFDDGWFMTGDLGHVDDDGFLYFIDRLSDVIITGGSNVHPSDVETVIRDFPDVDDCLVVGVKDNYLGQAVIAVACSPTSNHRTTERQLRAHCRSRLARNQQPLAWFFVDTLPLNAAGKVDRKAVRAYYDAQHLELSSRFAGLGLAAAEPP